MYRCVECNALFNDNDSTREHKRQTGHKPFVSQFGIGPVNRLQPSPLNSPLNVPLKVRLIQVVHTEYYAHGYDGREYEITQAEFERSDRWEYLEDKLKAHIGSMGPRDIYNTEDGKIHPGDMFWVKDFSAECSYWDNCPGQHLTVMLPDEHIWDIDSRAGNCARPSDRLHRCWQRSGEPPNITVGKGELWENGGGSIQTSGWHGYLRNGMLVKV